MEMFKRNPQMSWLYKISLSALTMLRWISRITRKDRKSISISGGRRDIARSEKKKTLKGIVKVI